MNTATFFDNFTIRGTFATMYQSDWFNNVHRSGILPSLHERKAVKDKDKWKRSVLDSFEFIAVEQFRENMTFWDYYRMVDGQIAFQELSEVIPQLRGIEDLLDGVGVPTFLKHYDILGVIVNALVGKYIDLQDKFHVIDTGEIAESEYLRYKNEEITEYLKGVIKNEVDLHMAKNGLTPEGKQFSSPEEEQAFLQQLEQARSQYVPQTTEKDSKKGFKTLGVQWGEATMERDRETFHINRKEKEEFKDFILTGRCFREYKLGYDRYYPKTWSPKNTFFSKEIDEPRVQYRSYVGRLHYYLPSEVIREYGHHIPTDVQKKLLGGSKSWETYMGGGVVEGSINQAIDNNFNKPTQVPFEGYFDYNFALGIQDELGLPMGEYTSFNKDGSKSVSSRFLPRMYQESSSRYNHFARILRNDFVHSAELCQVTEVYFIAYDLFGYLTYENEFGRPETVEVTEDILQDFLKENNIKQSYKETIVDIVDKFEVNTLQWVLTENTYEGVKVQSPNMTEPIYVYCKKMDHQIPGDSQFQRLLPVAGIIGPSPAAKIAPFQAQYNLCLNQIFSLLEKEIGMFFLMDVQMIPSEYAGFGDAEEAFFQLRSIAKNTGMMPVATAQDGQKTQSTFNQFSVYDISYTNQIASRINLADTYQRKAWEVIGINGGMLGQPTKYETAEGVRTSQDVSFAQVSQLYEDFSFYKKSAWDLHLAVAQYAQSSGKDVSLFYTKGDASIAYLNHVDEKLPLRKIGVLPSEDSRKRKELESFKQYMMSNNTMASDTIEFARLLSSDTMREALEIANAERKARMEQEQVEHQRNLELKDKEAQNIQMIEDRKDQREFRLQAMGDETKVEVARLTALGRASDKQSDQAGFEEINRAAAEARADSQVESKIQKDAENIRLKERIHNDNMETKFKDLALKAKALNENIEKRKSQERIAAMNKN